MTIATALAGEPLDALIWRNLGTTGGVVEQLLGAVPGLPDVADALPERFAIELPDRPADPAPLDIVQLWA